MGYRSDVTALIYPEGGEHNLMHYDKLKLLMNTTFKDLYNEWGGEREFDDGWEWDDNHRVLQFVCTSVKWYDSYPEVQQFGEFLAKIQELGYEYEVIRIGEEDTDIEYDSTGDAMGYLSVRRSIEVEF